MREDIRLMLETDTVINATYHPELARALNACRCRGDLTAVLPNIYSLPNRAQEFKVRLAAAAASTRPYVLLGRAAAKATWWEELECDVIDLAHPTVLTHRAGFRFHERFVLPGLIRGDAGLPATAPALTVLDLIPELGSEVVDEALRRRVVTLGHLQATLAGVSGLVRG